MDILNLLARFLFVMFCIGLFFILLVVVVNYGRRIKRKIMKPWSCL
jgi:hypothetical protein